MDQIPDTRFSLMEQLKNPGDAEAWNEFVAIYQPLIMSICKRKGIQHADATDLTQEVLSRVAKGIHNFRYGDAGSTLRGWLYRITRNLTIDFVRRRQRDPLAKTVQDEGFQYVPEPSREESLEFEMDFQKQMFLVVAKIVEQQVQPQTWSAFWKVNVEQQDPASVAEQLGLTRGAVYVAKCRVIAKLRKEVQKRLQETGQFMIQSATEK